MGLRKRDGPYFMVHDQLLEVNGFHANADARSHIESLLKTRPLLLLLRRRVNHEQGYELVSQSSLCFPGRWCPEARLWARTWLVQGSVGRARLEVWENPVSTDLDGINFLWPAALALAKFVESLACEQNWSASPPHVCELGAGCGLVSLAAAALGGRVVATDRAVGMPILERNINHNRDIVADVRAIELNWGSETSSVRAPDLVLASDVIYSSEAHDSLAVTVASLLNKCSGGHSCCWIAHDCSSRPGYQRRTERFFGDVCAINGLHVVEMRTARSLLDACWATEHITFHKLVLTREQFPID